MALHIYEFLYRGRPAGSAEAPDYHVILADDGTDAFGQPSYALSQAMTPAQAEKLGFGLPAILSAINADLMTENVTLKAQVADVQAENTALKAEQAAVPVEVSAPAPGSAA